MKLLLTLAGSILVIKVVSALFELSNNDKLTLFFSIGIPLYILVDYLCDRILGR